MSPKRSALPCASSAAVMSAGVNATRENGSYPVPSRRPATSTRTPRPMIPRRAQWWMPSGSRSASGCPRQ
ncbi:MAG TPA: hypothetical protein VH021_18405, partial [Trebonia sp.]|nr:hypothetical protein [Trebonia sp.]